MSYLPYCSTCIFLNRVVFSPDLLRQEINGASGHTLGGHLRKTGLLQKIKSSVELVLKVQVFKLFQ